MEIFETPLPGVGVRYEFTAEGGDHVGVIVRRDGKRDIALYDRLDPDSCKGTVELSESDAGKVAELLGGTQITARLERTQAHRRGPRDRMDHDARIGGLTGKRIADGQIRTYTSASVVAVIRGDTRNSRARAKLHLRDRRHGARSWAQTTPSTAPAPS